MRNRRALFLTAAVGLIVGSASALTALAGGCPTCGGGVVGAPVSAWGGPPAVAGSAYGSNAMPSGLTMDVFCGQGSGYCNQRYQLARRWAERHYVKRTCAAYIPIDPYAAALSMSGPSYAYPEGAQVVSTPQPAAIPNSNSNSTPSGADPAIQPPAASPKP